jgi:glycosyltransferase involved in cell wall biosynthesis
MMTAAAAVSLCLNMMVKNEEHIIIHTLKALTSSIKFDYWVITDTGSTDNTRQLILAFFAAKKIKGELIDDIWRDYGHNRTSAIGHAFNKTDYLLIFHADDIIDEKFKLPTPMTNDAYYLKLRNERMSCQHCLILNNRLHWSFRGKFEMYSENVGIINNSSRSLQRRVESITSLIKS